MAKVSELYTLRKPVLHSGFYPPSSVEMADGKIRLVIQQPYPGEFIVRRSTFPFAASISIRAEISTHDGVIRGGTITYPSGNGWIHEYVAQFKREMCKPEEPAKGYSLQLTP
ncbi:MAG: hypothetical protein HYT72_03345 [Candidatus Aenigmarchaeota archaeon]|nr:hypothetical protein [Candidatus Aenigmarchaeota archaeon]